MPLPMLQSAGTCASQSRRKEMAWVIQAIQRKIPTLAAQVTEWPSKGKVYLTKEGEQLGSDGKWPIN